MSAFRKRLDQASQVIAGAVTAIANPVTLSLTLEDEAGEGPSFRDYRHWFFAVEFYSDSVGTTVVAPTAGTLTYTLKSPVLPGVWSGDVARAGPRRHPARSLFLERHDPVALVGSGFNDS